MRHIGIGLCMIGMWGGAAAAAYFTGNSGIMIVPFLPSVFFAFACYGD